MVKKKLVVVKNAGNVKYTFYVGAFISRGRFAEFYPPRSLALDPGKQGTVTFYFYDDYLPYTETWYAEAKDCLAGASCTFKVSPRIKGVIRRIYAE